jgi:hypothetical protein
LWAALPLEGASPLKDSFEIYIGLDVQPQPSVPPRFPRGQWIQVSELGKALPVAKKKVLDGFRARFAGANVQP